MLLPKDTNPTSTVYYNGALVIQGLREIKDTSTDFFDLYQKLKQKYQLSFQSYVFALDWLYLLGSIRMEGNGKIEKCF